jgi:hypothetical protein
MVMPYGGYPHELTDDDLVKAVVHFAGLLKPTPDDVARFAPLVQIGQAELQMRTTRSLIEAIDTFKVSSEQAASRIRVLTWVLVALSPLP